MHKKLVNFSCTCHIADALVGVSACTLQIAIWCIIFLMYRSVFRLLCVVLQHLYLEWLTARPDREKWISSLQCIASCYKHSCDCARSINIDQKFPFQIALYLGERSLMSSDIRLVGRGFKIAPKIGRYKVGKGR